MELDFSPPIREAPPWRDLGNSRRDEAERGQPQEPQQSDAVAEDGTDCPRPVAPSTCEATPGKTERALHFSRQ
jgi:hypothetical protein